MLSVRLDDLFGNDIIIDENSKSLLYTGILVYTSFKYYNSTDISRVALNTFLEDV